MYYTQCVNRKPQGMVELSDLDPYTVVFQDGTACTVLQAANPRAALRIARYETASKAGFRVIQHRADAYAYADEPRSE